MSNVDFLIKKGVLKKYQGKDEHVVIPEGVTTIGEWAFSRCSCMQSVTIPDSVTVIENKAFHWCDSLESITIPNGVVAIGKGAFSDCHFLQSVTIPNSVTTIGESAFSNCCNLKSVTILGRVATIENSTFYNCHKLQSITILDGITTIGSQAFSHCYDLRSITIPDSVTTVGDGAFYKCWGLADEQGFVIANDVLFGYCGTQTEVVIPDGITAISSGAFHRCTNLQSIIIPNSVTTIGAEAFWECIDLQSITIPDSVTTIGTKAFCRCYGLQTITIPDSVTAIGEMAFLWCTNLKSVTIHGEITTIASGIFSDCSALQTVTIPDGVTTIGGSAFSGCSNLQSITIPDSVTTIGYKAFYSCKSLETVTISDSVTSVGDGAFRGCSGLKRVYLSQELDTIQAATFAGCSNLTEIYLPEKLQTIEKNAFDDCGTITFHLPEALAARKEPLPQVLCSHKIETTVFGYACLHLYQRMVSWQNWRFNRTPKDAAEEFGHMIALVEENPFDTRTAKPVAEFITKHYKLLQPESLKKMISLYRGRKCAEMDELSGNRSLMRYLGEEVAEEDPRERLIAELTERVGVAQDAASAVKNGIHWKGSRMLCPREALIGLISCYIKEWDRCAEQEQGEMTTMVMLRDGLKVKIDPDADRIADLLDRNELSAMLTKLVKGAKYRPYLLAWARFATEAEVAAMTATFKSMQRGKARERYFAENLEQALLISDTREAMLFYDRIDSLERYAKYRGMTAMELRDTAMMPDFGFEANGAKLYDIGGNTVEVRVTKGLAFALFDRNKQKEIRSFPKKSDDPAKAEAAAKDFAEFKKEIKKFIKLRSEQLCRMHVTGEGVKPELWRKTYLEHPVIKHLAEHIVWVDEAKQTFTVMDGKLVMADLTPYDPQGRIQVAHVLSMEEETIQAWQKTLAKTGQTQLFEQVWEPVMHWDKETLRERYNGTVITSKDRHALKANLNRRGIPVRAGEMEREFNAGAWGYDFASNNTMYFGKGFELDYSVDDKSGDLTLGKATLGRRCNEYELNAILLELDKASVMARIAADRADALSETVLNQFSAAQISAFLTAAMSGNSTNCTAMLLEYKNTHYPEYSAMDEFVLEW